jgi:hypothetical protein
MNQTLTPERQAVVDRVEAGLLDGSYFARSATGNRSVPLGRGPIAGRNWAQIMQAVALFATDGDRNVATAHQILGRVNPYLTTNEVVAQVSERLAVVASKGYHDVIGATGPESGRPSSHQHPTTLRQAIILALLLIEVEHAAGNVGHVPGIGWCLRALMDREGITVPAHLFPRLAAAEAKRAQG